MFTGESGTGDARDGTFGEALFAAAAGCEALEELVQRATDGGAVRVSGVPPAAVPFLLAVLRNETGRPLLLVVPGPREMEQAAGDLEELLDGGVYCFPPWETLPEEELEPHPDILGDRLRLLERLADGEGAAAPMVIVTTPRALSQKVVPPDALFSELFTLAPGMELSIDRLCRRFQRGGYRRVEMVEEKGEYCVRGGIVDIFPSTRDFPLRLDFFGEKLDSIRSFHANTQRSMALLPGARLPPFSELGLMHRHRDGLESLLGCLPAGTISMVQESLACLDALRKDAPRGGFFLRPEELADALARSRPLLVSLLPQESPLCPGTPDFPLEFGSVEPCRPVAPAADGDREWGKRIFSAIGRWSEEGLKILIACNNAGERRRLEELFLERGLRLPRDCGIFEARLSGGFTFPAGGVVVLTDKEIFARYKRYRPRRKFKGTSIGSEFAGFRRGDHVVHLNHGIGRYLGIRRLVKEGIEREYLCIEYRDEAKLYVPLDQASLVERYICPGKSLLRVDRLGGRRWLAARSAAKRAIHDFAADIISLQSTRRSRPGHSFGRDTEWQREFEDAFIYEETPDQAAAIEDVKIDMESPTPMDRLICGDVGYGKTEVAMRAAFKAVMDGRQVAVLVPTTVLAQQHLQTFTDRFADYPVRIEVLSRFRKEREQRRVVEGLGKGEVDIVIGTHRLVQPDISFKRLGLVIIDEEQRFGVKHKERLKRLRMTVDVLTMTATPIPRTLYMSMSGIRNMSTISTPPEDRLAIETFVREYDTAVVREALRRELARQGQAYFVHNRVETIERVCEEVRNIVPEATVAVAHGQMASDELEEVMNCFVEGKVTILVCTTIIESGLDIPNVNTIIIDRADRFGLADLYQLRGRVGRYRHRAYAYLLYPPGAVLPDEARRRLKAIAEQTSLGAGFKIALRDLEIRGAGNILGPQQHGHMAAIGFDLYCKLLKRSIEVQRGGEGRGIEGISVVLPYPTGIPADYIPFDSQRIDMHKRLGEVAVDGDLDAMASELRDRYGPLPESVRCLLELCRIKLRARDRNVSSVRVRGDKLFAVRDGEDIRPAGRYPRLKAVQAFDALREIGKIVRRL